MSEFLTLSVCQTGRRTVSGRAYSARPTARGLASAGTDGPLNEPLARQTKSVFLYGHPVDTAADWTSYVHAVVHAVVVDFTLINLDVNCDTCTDDAHSFAAVN